ncbi:MAG TPA: single-stranded DNA-binding protein [Bacteroidia bacterium]|jgi:single-strand DNA-binding protein
MAGVNKVILIGNLGRDPEVRHLEGGATVANFPIATTETYKDKNGNRQEQTEWHNIVLWRSLADVAEKYLKKGMQIYIEGKLRTRSWEDKDGNKRYTTEVVGETFTMLSSRKNNEENNNAAGQQNNTSSTNQPIGNGNTDDLPF